MMIEMRTYYMLLNASLKLRVFGKGIYEGSMEGSVCVRGKEELKMPSYLFAILLLRHPDNEHIDNIYLSASSCRQTSPFKSQIKIFKSFQKNTSMCHYTAHTHTHTHPSMYVHAYTVFINFTYPLTYACSYPFNVSVQCQRSCN